MSIFDQFSEEDRQRLDKRAARVAGASGQADTGDTITALLIQLRGETYAMPIDTITAVNDNNTLLTVPCVPAYVAGIANMRGHIIPVLDLAEVLGVPGATQHSGILIRADHDDIALAFEIEAVGEVTSLSVDALDPIPDILDVRNTDYLRGTFPNGIILLDVLAILTDPDLEINDGRE